MFIIVLILIVLLTFYIYKNHVPCVLLYNVIKPITYTHNVPKIIFRTHRDRLVSSSMYEYCHDKWIELNPDYSMVWYTNKDCDRFMLKMGDRINKAYLKLKPGAFKADLWRACILYKYGGIYVDSYATPEVGLEEMLKNYWDAGKEQLISIKDNVLYDCFGKKKYAIHNGFIVASKNHRKLGEYIYRIVSNVETNYYGTHPLDITGPICMYNVIKNECRFLRFYKWNWYQHVRNDKRELVMKKKYSLISYLYEKLVRMSASYPYMWETRDVYN